MAPSAFGWSRVGGNTPGGVGSRQALSLLCSTRESVGGHLYALLVYVVVGSERCRQWAVPSLRSEL